MKAIIRIYWRRNLSGEYIPTFVPRNGEALDCLHNEYMRIINKN